GALLALRPQLSPVLRAWLDALLVSDDAGVSVQRALERHRLPNPVFQEFTGLCQRRLRWRAGHGRAAPLAELPEALSALIALVATRAEDAADRHLSAGRSAGDRVLRRALARAREFAWLATWLVRLLMRHEAGELAGRG